MPLINVKTSAELNEAQIKEIVKEMGQAITLFPGKSESHLMVNIEKGCDLYFRGNDDKNTAFVDVAIFGSSTKVYCELVTERVCEILEKTVGIPSDRTYVKFEFNTLWGHDKSMY